MAESLYHKPDVCSTCRFRAVPPDRSVCEVCLPPGQRENKMSDAEFNATVKRVDDNIVRLNQFLDDCETLRGIAARYPVGTKLGNAVAIAHAVFMAKATGVGAMLGPVDPMDATEPAT